MIPSLYPHLDLADYIAFLSIGTDASSAFEGKLKRQFNFRYSLTFSSGRAGLYSILKAHGIQGKNVLISAYTCCVVTEAIVQSGNRPVFIDIEDKSVNARVTESCVRKYGSNLGAVVITNLYGIIDFSESDIIRRGRKYLVILDDALSPGHVPQVANSGYDYVIISCGVRKPFTCLGGGIVFTQDREKFNILQDYVFNNRRPTSLSRRISRFVLALLFFFTFRPVVYSFTSFVRRRTGILSSFFNERQHDIHQVHPEYHEDMCGFQKRIGVHQLDKLDRILERRKEIGNTYYELLRPHFEWVEGYWRKDIPYSHIPFLYPRRDELEEYLLKKGIDVEKYFDYVIPKLGQYNAGGEFKNAERLAREMINLPINVGLDERLIAKIVNEVIQFDIASNKMTYRQADVLL